MKKINKPYFLLMILPFLVGATAMLDPTKPPDISVSLPEEATETGVVELTGTFISHQSKMAMINGQWLKVGDRVGEFAITAITPYTVKLIGQQANIETLKLAPKVKTKIGKDVDR